MDALIALPSDERSRIQTRQIPGSPALCEVFEKTPAMSAAFPEIDDGSGVGHLDPESQEIIKNH
jgi:hypothetical protein